VEANYPESLKAVYAINIPNIFYAFLKMMTPFLASATTNKFHLYGSDENTWKTELRKIINSSDLPIHLGGEREFDTKNQAVNPGGQIPAFYYKNTSIQSAEANDKMVSAQILKQEGLSLEFNVKQLNTILSYEFHVDNNDIGFEVIFLSETDDITDVIVPYTRCSQFNKQEETLFGGIGKYIFTFDNSYSLWKKKVIHYRITSRNGK